MSVYKVLSANSLFDFYLHHRPAQDDTPVPSLLAPSAHLLSHRSESASQASADGPHCPPSILPPVDHAVLGFLYWDCGSQLAKL